MSKRSWYEVRIRECTLPPKDDRPGKWAKKSRFYFATGPRDAASKYKGKGQVISTEKVEREQLAGVGSFFTLGDKILRELRAEENRKQN